MEALDSKEVADWVAASKRGHRAVPREAAAARAFTSGSPSSGTTRASSVPVVEEGQLFYSRNTGLQRQAPIFMRDGHRRRRTTRHRSERHLGRRLAVARAVDAVARRRSCSPTGCPKAARTGRRSTCATCTGKDLADEVRWMRFSDIVVDERQQGLLLFALSGAAEEQGARGGAVRPRALLPPRRHTAVAGHADLRA